MILFTENGDKIHCWKCNSPKASKTLYSELSVVVDENRMRFMYPLRNNGSYFYFKFYNDVWYKTPIVSNNGFDVFIYITEQQGKLYSIKNAWVS